MVIDFDPFVKYIGNILFSLIMQLFKEQLNNNNKSL